MLLLRISKIDLNTNQIHCKFLQIEIGQLTGIKPAHPETQQQTDISG